MTNVHEILEQALSKKTFSQEQLSEILACQDPAPLFEAADFVRQRFVGDGVHLRALVEFSNYCKNDCLYCGIRCSNRLAQRYRLSLPEIIQATQEAAACGYKTVVLQSGEDPWFDADKICALISEIKKLNLAVTLSIGEKSYEEYKAYRQAGADRYLLRIETTNKFVYEKLDPAMSWENRVRCLEDLKKLGYEVGSGSLVGLPGQRLQDLAADLLFFQKFPVDMAGIGPFIPHPQTPLANETANGNFELSLKMMALMRLLMPDINIPATTAMETLHPQGRLMALQCGANVVMPNVTKWESRQKYELYPGKACNATSPADYLSSLQTKIKNIGRYIAHGYGFRGDYLKHRNQP